MPRLAFPALALLFALLLACSESGGTTAPQTPQAACALPHESGEFDETITSGGLQRAYILHVPPGYDGSQRTPLVLLLHGFALTGRIMLDYSELGVIADREGFIIVAPTGAGDPPRWNSSVRPEDPGDLAFIGELLDRIERELCIDTERVFATGYSNGGGMSMRLACDMPERVRAVGLVASVFLDCAPRTPLIAFHGLQDMLVAFEGSGMFPSIREAVASWAGALECAGEPEVTDPSAHIELTSYDGCAEDDAAVRLYVVDGGGHTWPGADLFGDPAQTTQEIDASELIWQFFAGR